MEYMGKPLNISEEARVQMPMKDGGFTHRDGSIRNLWLLPDEKLLRNLEQAQYSIRN